jgi:hypothetical protein
MTARTGMATLITQLRGLTEAGTADYSVAGQSYWTDDQLQVVLDYNRIDIRHASMEAIPAIGENNQTTWKEYQIGWQDLESDPVIQDGYGATVGTANYSFDSRLGIVTFTTDRGGSVHYLTGHAYNLNNAASQVWSSKAAHYASAYDFSTDNMSAKRSQLISHARQMAQLYGSMNNDGSIYLERADV